MATRTKKAPAAAPAQQSLAPAAAPGQLDVVATPIVKALTELTAEAGKVAPLIERGRELHRQYEGVAFDCATPKGMRDAAEARRMLRVEARFPLQTLQKDVSKQFGAMQRQWNETLTGYCEEVEGYEKPIDDQITAQERREKERKDALEARIRDIQGTPDKAIGKDIETLAQIVQGLEEQGTPDKLATFEEYREAAAGAIEQALSKVRALHAQAVQAEEGRKALEQLRVDQARKDAIRVRISAISDFLGQVTLCRTAARVQELIARLLTIEIDSSFAEFTTEAQDVKNRVLQQLITVRDAKKEAEEAREQLAAAQAAAPASTYPPLTAEHATADGLPATLSATRPAAGVDPFVQSTRGEYLPREQGHEALTTQQGEKVSIGYFGGQPAASVVVDAEVDLHRPTDAEILSVLVDHYDTDARTVAAWLRAFDAEAALAQQSLIA